MQLVTTKGATDHAISVSQAYHQRRIEGCTTTDFTLGVIRSHPFTLGQTMVLLPELIVVCLEKLTVVIDDFKVHTRPDTQCRRFDLSFNFRRAANQYWSSDAFITDHLHRTQYALILTLRKHDLFRRQFGLRKHRFHDHAGVIDEFIQALEIRIPVTNRPRRHTRVYGRLCDCRRDLYNQSRIERFRNQVLMTETGNFFTIGRGHHIRLLSACQIGNRFDGSQLHLFRDRCCTDIQRPSEDEGEAKHVIHLIRIIRTSGGDNGVVTYRLDFMRQNFRGRIG